MSSSGTKRKRATNFSQLDKQLVVELVAEKKSIIENTKTDNATASQKNDAWIYITNRFNAISSGGPRTANELRNKYHNLKQDLRKKTADGKRYLYGTGGGPHVSNNLNCTEELLSSLLAEETISGMRNQFDSDGPVEENVNVVRQELPFSNVEELDDEDELQENNEEESLVSNLIDDSQDNNFIETIRIDNEDNNLIEESPSASKWENYSPKDLRRQKHNKLKVNNCNNMSIDNQIKQAQLALIKKQLELCDRQKTLSEKQIILCDLQIKEVKAKISN